MPAPSSPLLPHQLSQVLAAFSTVRSPLDSLQAGKKLGREQNKLRDVLCGSLPCQ